MTASGHALLRVAGVSKSYGAVSATTSLSFDVAPGERLAIIGPNGAGKSTLLKLISGHEKPTRGIIELADRGRVSARAPHAVTRSGIALARQVPRPLRTLTVADNIRVGLAAGNGRDKRSHHARLESILDITGLGSQRDRLAGEMPLLDLKRLEVARALSSAPRLLLLDEVSAGLNGHDIEVAIDMLRRISAEGTALLIVEHVQQVIQELAQRVIVLNFGTYLAEGTPSEVSANADVQRVYLGDGPRPEGAAVVAPASTASDTAAGGLQIRDLVVKRGAVRALNGVDIEIPPSSIVTVLGANGAGKSTLVQAVSGLVRPSSGSLTWEGAEISRIPTHGRARLGIAHCQEGRKLFPGMTVRENLELGAYGTPSRERAERLERIFEIFPILADRAKQEAVTMSGGQQQMVAIGRALMSAPRLLLLDEVTLGLSPKVADEIYESLVEVAATGTSMVLVEQDTRRSLSVASYCYVLARGRVAFEGPSSSIDRDALLNAYLGADLA